jgi:hypothetical protein
MSHRNTSAKSIETASVAARRLAALRGLVLILVVLLITSGGAG